jgi:hypothetical protein
LAQRISGESLVLPQNGPGLIDDLARRGLASPHSDEETAVVAATQEAQILTFPAIGDLQLSLAGELADFCFGQTPEGELSPGQLSLIQHTQNVGLVFGPIDSP